jgi:hypothetical protein
MRASRNLAVESILSWLPLAALIAVLTITIYAAVQQVERGSANDPQIQIATDAANALNAGASPRSLVAATPIDIASSYAPYLVIYDANAAILATSATVNGQALVPPSGVFSATRSSGLDLITWTPAPGVRSAVAVVPYTHGYVLSGRSLKLIEDRETNLEYLVGAGGAVALVVTFLTVVLARALMRLAEQSRTANT